MTGQIKTGNLTGHQLSRLGRFREMAEAQLRNLGAAIKDAREEKGLSRSQLGREVHVEEKTVERWEKGLTGGAMDSLHLIAPALDRTTDQLLAAAAAQGRAAAGRGDDLMAALRGAGADASPEQRLANLEAGQVEILAGQVEILEKLDALQRLQAPARKRQGRGG